MKSQVAWVKKKMKGGPRVDSWKLASATEIGRNVLDLCWQKTWPLFDMFTWCKTHPTQHTYINTITHRDNSDTNTCTEGPWNVKSCWWLIWSANSWGCYAVLTAVCWRKPLWLHIGTSSNAASYKTPQSPLPCHPTHSTTLHPPILGPNISAATLAWHLSLHATMCTCSDSLQAICTQIT